MGWALAQINEGTQARMTKTPEQLLDDASAWWTTEIIDIHPGKISMISVEIGRAHV